MREHAFTTSVIWIALAVATGLILNTVRYAEPIQSPIDPSVMIVQTMYASTPWMIGAGLLLFMLFGCAMGATVAIWQSANGGSNQQAALQQAEKAKRDNRDARIKRLVATLDDDDLDALEQGRIDEEGERLSLESLLGKHS